MTFVLRKMERLVSEQCARPGSPGHGGEMTGRETGSAIKVFVHLAYGFGCERRKRRWESGELIGVNEPVAYGYHRARSHGCVVAFSTDHDETWRSRLIRGFFRRLSGFDLVHAWRNRAAMLRSDVIWTHTESQSLAVAAILRWRGGQHKPKTILQSVWLMDEWAALNVMQRWLYKILLAEADILSFLSGLNARQAAALFPHQRVEHVLYGICADALAEARPAPAHEPIRVLAVGNDRHRDWATLRAAIAGHDAFELRAVTTQLPADFLQGNCRVIRVKNNAELLALYRWADLAVVPLKPNLHASGITAIQEAITQGVAVICTDTGGLGDYFGPDAVEYVAPGDAPGLRARIADLSADPDRRARMVRQAQTRMSEGGLNSEGFVRRYVELSRELLTNTPAD